MVCLYGVSYETWQQKDELHVALICEINVNSSTYFYMLIRPPT